MIISLGRLLQKPTHFSKSLSNYPGMSEVGFESKDLMKESDHWDFEENNQPVEK